MELLTTCGLIGLRGRAGARSRGCGVTLFAAKYAVRSAPTIAKVSEQPACAAVQQGALRGEDPKEREMQLTLLAWVDSPIS